MQGTDYGAITFVTIGSWEYQPEASILVCFGDFREIFLRHVLATDQLFHFPYGFCHTNKHSSGND